MESTELAGLNPIALTYRLGWTLEPSEGAVRDAGSAPLIHLNDEKEQVL
jgi:hypothetical protein